MAIKAKALVTLFRQALDERWGYIWGESGDVWSAANQSAATREMTVEHGSKWIGRRVADCSGLFVWAYRELGEKIYHGSNTIFEKHTNKTGALFGEVEILPGTAVFQTSKGRRTHIGLYVGDGEVIEARGTRSGVIESDLSEWDEWGTLSAVDYSDEAAESVLIDTLKTLRKGDSGLTVQWLQEMLLAAGHELGKADGVFGSKTEAAVRAFQRASGLVADGIAGKKTIAALTALDGEQEETPEDDETEETKVAHSPLTVAQRLMQLELAVFGMSFEAGGGESNGS